MGHIMTYKMVEKYGKELHDQEKSEATVGKYLHDIRHFLAFIPEGKKVDKEVVIAYKEQLKRDYKATSANSMLVALNGFFTFMGWAECRVRQFRIQKVLFCKEDRYLTKEEYKRLLKIAIRHGDDRLCMVMQTICSTGIRVSELQYITVRSMKSGVAQVSNKGKERQVFLPRKLSEALERYCRKNNISSGPIFLTKRGNILNRRSIWHDMKALCEEAGVDRRKVFPHNLRHLFAFTFYSIEKDLLRLAEVLGHSSMETTRIYTITTGSEHRRMLSRLGLLWEGDDKRVII